MSDITRESPLQARQDDSVGRGVGGENYLVLQCYGSEGIFHECTYALLSLSRLYTPEELANVEIWLYTDKPEWFKGLKDCWLPLHYRQINDETIKQWRGQINFVHRVKIEVLKDFVKNRQGNVLYLDTDIVFTGRIDQLLKNINTGQLYMHVREGLVSDRGNNIFAKLDTHLRKNVSHKVNDRPVHELAMWNAGVLGFNTKYNYVLDEVLAFTDSQYPVFPKHVVEQFAFSVYFQQAGVVRAAAPYIFHYWKLKEARHLLASFFEHFKDKSWDDLVRYSALVQVHVLMQEKLNFFQNRSVHAHIMKKQWLPERQDWEELTKQI